jgi:hypothetical protein
VDGVARYHAAARDAAYVDNVYFMNYEVLCLRLLLNEIGVLYIFESVIMIPFWQVFNSFMHG